MKHGITSESIAHTVTFALYGPDAAGNVLEVIGRFEPEDVFKDHEVSSR